MSITEKRTKKKVIRPSMQVTRKQKVAKKNEAHTTIKKVIHPASDEVSLELKAEQPYVRYLKIQPHYRQWQCGETVVSELRLNGRWLESAGFDIGNYVSVTIMDGLLIIKPATAVYFNLKVYQCFNAKVYHNI